MARKPKTNDITKEQGETAKTILGAIIDLFVDKDEKSGRK